MLLVKEIEKIWTLLAQQVTRAEFNELKESVGQLIKAQKRTEQRVEELAEAQKRTEQVLKQLIETQQQLAEAQKRTQAQLRELIQAHQETRDRLEGLSHTVGYTLEDRALRGLPALLAAKGIQVEGRLIRTYVQMRTKHREVNIFGYGYKDGQRVLILGEVKIRPLRKEIRRFLKLATWIQQQEGIPAVLLFVAYDFPPPIQAYLEEQGIWYIWSYELEL